MDFNKLVEEHSGGFEDFVAKIPGYKGYKQKETRREADKLLRTKLANDLDLQRRRLGEQQLALINAGKIEHTDDLERAVTKMQTLIDRIRTATYGYSGLFDAVKVKEKQLDDLYAFDVALVDKLPDVAGAIDAIEDAIDQEGEIGAAIKSLSKVLTQFNNIFSKRQEAIQKTSDSAL